MSPASLTVSAWLVGAAVLLGVLLAGFYLTERPIRGAARSVSVLHGALASAGTALALTAGGLRLNTLMLLAALVGGALIVVAKLRRQRPAGLIVALHATFGVAGAVLLAAALARP